jgi:hypothetical protein
MQHAEENNILYPLQHGFRKGRSCETQLIEFVDDISKNLQEGRQTEMICSRILQQIKVITKLPNSEQSYKGKVQTHNYINRQNQSTGISKEMVG